MDDEYGLNSAPVVHASRVRVRRTSLPAAADGGDVSSPDGARAGAPPPAREPIDAEEVFEMLRHLNDPEHPLTLEQLAVVQLPLIAVDDAAGTVDVRFTPTIPHCSMSTLIGLSIRVKLLRSLPRRFKATVRVTPGAHSQEAAVNKQLADKERVCAALENGSLIDVVNKAIAHTDRDV